MSTLMRSINGIIVHAKYFAFDGCHKFYLLHDNSERSTMVMSCPTTT